MTTIYKLLLSILLFYNLFVLLFKVGTLFIKNNPQFYYRTQRIKETMISVVIFLLLFGIASVLLTLGLNTFAPTQSEEVNELIKTIVSGDDFSLWDIISTLLFSGFSFDTIHETLITILLTAGFVYIIVKLVEFLDPLAKLIPVESDSIPCVPRPLDIPFISIPIFLLLTLYSFTNTPDSINLLEFIKFIFQQLFEIVDKVKLARVFGLTITALTGVNTVRLVMLVTPIFKNHNLVDVMDSFDDQH